MARPNMPKPALLTTYSTSTSSGGQRRGDPVAAVGLLRDRTGMTIGRAPPAADDFAGQRFEAIGAPRHQGNADDLSTQTRAPVRRLFPPRHR